MLLLLFTFARSETPCPKTTGGFDEHQHLMVCDVIPEGTPFRLHVRLKRIKQDQRLERPEAAGNEDFATIGDTPESLVFSIRIWMQHLLRLHAGARDDSSPFFVSPCARGEALTYQTGMRHVRDLWAKASSEDEALKYGETGVWAPCESPAHAASTASSTVDADLMVTDGDGVVVDKNLQQLQGYLAPSRITRPRCVALAMKACSAHAEHERSGC